MEPKTQPSDQPASDLPPTPAAPPPGYPPGYVMPSANTLGYPQMPGGAQPNLGYPMGYPQMPYPGQPPMGYPPGYPMPMQPGMMPPASAGAGSAPMPIPAMPAPSSASSAVPLVRADAPGDADEDGSVLAVQSEDGEVFIPPALTHIEPPRRVNPVMRMWRKVGGGSLTLSLAIHAGILIVGGAIVVSSQMIQKQVDFLPGGGTQQGEKASAEMKHKVQQKKRNTLNKTLPMQKIVSTSQNSAVTLPDAPPDLLDVPDVSSMMGGGSLSGGFGKAGSGGGFGKGMGMGSAQGFVSLPPSMRSRCSTQERLEKLRQNGGNAECERAVSQSLEWLKSQQNPDGSWGRNGGKSDKAAMTGLALLCYLGRCETPDSPFYGDTVMKGIMYLIELSKKNEHGAITEDFKGNAGAYEHGIATYALGEMYTLARLGSKELPGMRDAFEKGVRLIIKCQNKADAKNGEGSWDYYTKNISEGKPTSTREDLSVAGWQYQALKAAKFTGLKIEGLHSAIDKTCDYIERKQTKDGGFGGADRDQHYNQWSLSGVGSLGLQTLSKGRTQSIKKGITFLRNFLTAEPLDWNKNCNLYCWYYYTQTFFQAGGDDWKFYNEQFLPQILANQNPDGSFKKGRPNWPGGDAADPVYRQTLCTLQLEVYYRYLKVGDREEESFFDRQ
ncbi:MAG TPA: prenyltransferase/squalene oxidase repeat-containing protein [Prosthecobacter sp.]|nr:prenyltransferase/squalene oxidase repeat-containing protein [Prosthecobacter sp.]